jgi:hypothetical protein
MRFQFRALPPNDDIVLNHSGDGYHADSPDAAFERLATELSPPTQDAEKLKARYTVEEMRGPEAK